VSSLSNRALFLVVMLSLAAGFGVMAIAGAFTPPRNTYLTLADGTNCIVHIWKNNRAQMVCDYGARLDEQ
jgi:hypothetical protein